MTSGLKGVVYTTLIAGTMLGGGYLIDRGFNLGIKENIAGCLVDNPVDAAKIYLNELGKSKNNTKYQNQISGVIVRSGTYLDDTTKVLTADELMRMSTPGLQESYLESKLEQLPMEKKIQLTEKTLSTLPMDKILYLIESQPDSVQNGIVKHVVGVKIEKFYFDVKEDIKKAYDETIGKFADKDGMKD
jgi:hypothetical protein